MSGVIHIIDDTTLPGVPRPAKKSDFAGGPGGGSLTNEQLRESLVPVDTLAAVGVARQLAAGAATANTALTATARRISIHARLADIRYAIGTGAQTASATSHYIAMGERLDLDVPASAQIAVIRAGTTDAVLEVSELTL
jgi:hypothetical protein